MAEPQTYSDFFEWLITRKASSTSEVRDWYAEYSSFVNEIDAEVKLNRIKAVFQSDTTPETLVETNSNSLIFNGTVLATQVYNLPVIDAGNVGMIFRVASDTSSNAITMLRSGSDVIHVNGVYHGTAYSVSGAAIDIVARSVGIWEITTYPRVHTLGGASHIADTLANLNTKISDATVDDENDNRIVPWSRGWELPTAFTLSFDDPTRTLTVGLPTSPPLGYFRLWQGGQSITKTAPETIVIPDTEGWHIIYYDNGVLTQAANPTRQQVLNAIRLNPLVCYVYWDATNSMALKILYEGHLYQTDFTWHLSQHTTFNALFSRGMDLTDIVADSTSPTIINAQYGMAEGVGEDEDLAFTGNAVLSTDGLDIYKFEGPVSAPYLRKYNTANLSIQHTGGLLTIQDSSGANFADVTVSDNTYSAYHVYADNNYNGDKTYFTVPGRSQHTSIAAAVVEANIESRTIKDSGLLGPEVLRVASVIFRSRNIYSYPSIFSIPANGDYIDYRYEKGGGGSTTETKVLNDNADVNAVSPQDDDALVRNGLTGLWEKSPYNRRRYKRTPVTTATYTALLTDFVLDVQYDGPVEITLPNTALALDGRDYSISDRWRKSASVNNITVVNESGDTIAIINASGTEIDVISDATEWS